MTHTTLARTLRAAAPIIVGYLALGVPCGVLGARAGMSLLQVALLSLILYSGSGQYMIASLYLGGLPPVNLALTVAMVNARQLLYASALLPRFEGIRRRTATIAASNITDESFGVNVAEYEKGSWGPWPTYAVNWWSQLTWIVANVVGALIGGVAVIDIGVAAFAMTSIFTCLLLMQKGRASYVIAGVAAALAVAVCKLVGLADLAILIGALVGVLCGAAAPKRFGKGGEGRDAVD